MLGTAYKLLGALLFLLVASPADARTTKPILYGQHWVAIAGKPLAAAAGARIFEQGGNAVDAACAMLGVSATMFDVMGWGGETQALIFDPRDASVVGINALGVAPTGATPEFFREQGLEYPPAYGPLAAVTPGTPGGLMVMLAEYGRLSLATVLAPAIRLAQGYPIEAQTADSIEQHNDRIREWPASRALFLVHEGEAREAPHAGEIFRQPDLERTLRALVAAEAEALAAGLGRRESILEAYKRFYQGDIALAFVEGVDAVGGLITLDDLKRWQLHIETPVTTKYRDLDVYKLNSWTQGPVMLQALNMLERLDVGAMGYNSPSYIHHVYQVMNLAFADRDFYYGDPYRPPEEPLAGLLSPRYAAARLKTLNPDRNDPTVAPGDPYRFQSGSNPYAELLEAWRTMPGERGGVMPKWQQATLGAREDFVVGTTSIQAADADGWVVSMTPSGGWIPTVIAGRTGIGMSQRMQSFVVEAADNPYNVVAPGQRPRVTLTPTLVMKDGAPYLSASVQGGDTQDQVLLQFLLAVADFGMNVQEAAEAPHFWSYQMRSSFGAHTSEPGRILLRTDTPAWTRRSLQSMGYRLEFRDRTSGPINAIYFDRARGTFQGGSSDFGEDYGIAW